MTKHEPGNKPFGSGRLALPSGITGGELLTLSEFQRDAQAVREFLEMIRTPERNGDVTVGEARWLKGILAKQAEVERILYGHSIEELKDYRQKHPDFHVVLPEDIMQTFGVSSVGRITPPPRELIAILDGKCDLYPDKKVRETHFLAYLPTHLGENTFSLLLLHEKGNEVFKEQVAKRRQTDTQLFWHSVSKIWWPNQPFARDNPTEGQWLLVPKEPLPETLNLTYADQEPIAQRFSNYRTARAIEHISALILTDLVHKHRYYHNRYGFCEDLTIADPGRIEADLRVGSGNFFAEGLEVDGSTTGGRDNSLGRAGLREFPLP